MTSSSGLNCYNDADMKGLSTTMFSFEYFRERDLLYVDKTSYVHKMVSSDDNFFFLSRPRRFGKSLFCSILHALFDGRKKLFEGLYIEDKYSFEKYPVIHFDFSGMAVDSEKYFIDGLNKYIKVFGRFYGVEIEDSYPGMMLEDLITGLYFRYGKIVIIIDEFDAPITNAINEKQPTFEFIRNTFNRFYATIKKCSSMIRFFFMTGVTKLSNLSIFSAMNNLVDISMDPEFAGAFGYTDEELDEYFGEGIDENWSKSCSSREEFREKIREYYDGYRFSTDADVRVYNPVSIGRFFSSHCSFRNYWIDTGSTSMAVNFARKYNLLSLVEDKPVVRGTDFSVFDISALNENNFKVRNVYSLLYYSGYLTIKETSRTGYVLGFPNREVSVAFTELLVDQYTPMEIGEFLKNGGDYADSGDVDGLLSELGKFLTQFPYQFFERNNERTFHLIFHAFFVALGGEVYAEDTGKNGRADEVLKTDRYIYIFELKLDGCAEEALNQIKEKHYAEKYLPEAEKSGRKIILTGINFSSEERAVTEYKSEILQ